MQLLFDYSVENGKTKGLGLLKGSVKKFDFKNKEIKIPNIGWNKVMTIKKNKIFSNINKMDEFYFVHSYYIKTKEKKSLCLIQSMATFHLLALLIKNIYGCQFHPERSRNQGLIF